MKVTSRIVGRHLHFITSTRPIDFLQNPQNVLGIRHLLPIFVESHSGFSGRDLNVKDYEEVMAYYYGSFGSGALVSG